MDWKITVLCENTVPKPGLVGEHGFAALIEVAGESILFDTGQGFALIPNALRLNKDLRLVSQVVLSHGHFDHTGGLLAFLGIHGPCDITAHPDILSERFWRLPSPTGEAPLSIGIPWREAYLTSRGARFQWRTEFCEIAEDIFLTGEVPRISPFEKGDPKMTIMRDGQEVQDPFLDDYSLAVKTPQGLVVLLGCAHAGLINILDHLIAKTGEDRIHAIVGGTHLGFLSDAHLDETIRSLKAYRVETLAASHCTGQRPVARLAAEFGTGFAFGHVGFVLPAQS